jgi:hypothetical protein
MVKFKAITTKPEQIFDSFNLVGKYLQVGHGVIDNYFKRNQVNGLKPRFIFYIIEKPVSHLPLKTKKILYIGVKIEVLNVKTDISKVYPSIRAAARALSIEHSTVRYTLI